MLFSSIAFAQAAAPSAGATQASFMQILPPFLIAMAVMYFMIIRPQQKQQKAQQKLLESVRRGDEIITTSGIHGKIQELDEKIVTLLVAPNVSILIERSMIQTVKNAQA